MINICGVCLELPRVLQTGVVRCASPTLQITGQESKHVGEQQNNQTVQTRSRES